MRRPFASLLVLTAALAVVSLAAVVSCDGNGGSQCGTPGQPPCATQDGGADSSDPCMGKGDKLECRLDSGTTPADGTVQTDSGTDVCAVYWWLDGQEWVCQGTPDFYCILKVDVIDGECWIHCPSHWNATPDNAPPDPYVVVTPPPNPHVIFYAGSGSSTCTPAQ